MVVLKDNPLVPVDIKIDYKLKKIPLIYFVLNFASMSLTTDNLRTLIFSRKDDIEFAPYLDRKNPLTNDVDYWQILGELEYMGDEETYKILMPMTCISSGIQQTTSIYESPQSFLKMANI